MARVRALANPDRDVERCVHDAFRDVGEPGGTVEAVDGIAHVFGPSGPRQLAAAVVLVAEASGVAHSDG